MENGQAIRVTRGRYKGATGAVEESDQLTGFYWCWLDRTKQVWRGEKRVFVPAEPIRVMLAEGQLQRA